VVSLSAGKKPKFISSAEIAVEPRALQKEGLENPEEAATALKQALENASPKPIKAKEVYVSVSEAAIFRKTLEIPKHVTSNELPTVIRAAIVEFLPDDIDSLELDYQPLPVGKDADTQQVMVVAVSKKLIEQYLNVCKVAGLTARAIDPTPSALFRSVIGAETTEPIVILDIGSEMSTVVLCAEHAVWVASTVTMGGNMLKDPATDKIDEDKKEEKMKLLVSSLTDELDHVVKFYANRSSGTVVKIQEVRVTGSGSLIDGIDKALSDETGMKVVLAHAPFELPTSCNRSYMTALGSALYPMYDSL
jgi:type IV pilus assembly protein PilM